MNLQTKALYNLLRLKKEEDPSLEAPLWALRDYRKMSFEEVVAQLQELKVVLDKSSFFEYAAQCDTPEELSLLLSIEGSSREEQDRLYLLLFELWRRFLPEQQSISIFCDELDFRIGAYDTELLESDELIQSAIGNLLEILDENADSGMDPKEIFKAISEYFAHDIERFIFDYIIDLLDYESTPYAADLIEGFGPYFQNRMALFFLEARLFAFSDIAKSNDMIDQLLKKEVSPSLLFEIVRYLSTSGEHLLFKKAVKLLLKKIEQREEL